MLACPSWIVSSRLEAGAHRIRHSSLLLWLIGLGAGSLTGGDWRTRAACVTGGVDVDVFFPTAEGSALAYAKARRVCAACPVRARCLDWAVEHGERFGMWGGLTPVERRTVGLRRARRRGW